MKRTFFAKPCIILGALFLLLTLPSQSQAQVLTTDKNPDFRTDCEKDQDVKSLQDKVLYGYPELEPCYEIALIDCQLRGMVDPKRKAELESKRNGFIAGANDKGINCSVKSKKKPKLDILISREYEGGSYKDQKRGREESCITGYLSINGTIVGYTLELPYRNNQSIISSIPAGEYDATIKFEGGKGPYENEGFRITLLNVPGDRSGIQIHIGNYPTQIEGCILVGTKVHPDTCTLEGSKVAYQTLKKAVQDQAESDASAEEKKITVTIQNTGR